VTDTGGLSLGPHRAQGALEEEHDMARSITTTDHDTIRKWAEERGGKPSEVASTARGDDVGIIRVDFPGFSGEGKLQEISWDDWFKKFDEANLAFVYEEETAEGQRSNFNKLVGRETAAARAKGEKTSRRSMRSGARKSSGTGPRGSRQAARPEAARTARSTRSSRGGAPAKRGSGGAKAKKAAPSRKRATTSRRGGASSSSSRKGGRARGARKGK
jgi:hypothetical protein